MEERFAAALLIHLLVEGGPELVIVLTPVTRLRDEVSALIFCRRDCPVIVGQDDELRMVRLRVFRQELLIDAERVARDQVFKLGLRHLRPCEVGFFQTDRDLGVHPTVVVPEDALHLGRRHGVGRAERSRPDFPEGGLAGALAALERHGDADRAGELLVGVRAPVQQELVFDPIPATDDVQDQVVEHGPVARSRLDSEPGPLVQHQLARHGAIRAGRLIRAEVETVVSATVFRRQPILAVADTIRHLLVRVEQLETGCVLKLVAVVCPALLVDPALRADDRLAAIVKHEVLLIHRVYDGFC